MKFMACGYLVAFVSTWGVAVVMGENGREFGVVLLGLAWVLGLGMSLTTLLRGDSNVE